MQLGILDFGFPWRVGTPRYIWICDAGQSVDSAHQGITGDCMIALRGAQSPFFAATPIYH
jgi:hypothetical protein